jgi:hypothetical protein
MIIPIYVQKINLKIEEGHKNKHHTHLFIYGDNATKGFILDRGSKIDVFVAVEILQALYSTNLRSCSSSSSKITYSINKTEYDEWIDPWIYAHKCVMLGETIITGSGREIIKHTPEPKYIISSLKAKELIADLLPYIDDDNDYGFVELLLDLQLR